MKITKTITSEFEFDYDAEIKRLKDNFQGDQLQRQLSILNHFMNGKYELMEREYENLPYDENEECPEQEYTGSWFGILFCGTNEYWGKNRFKMTRKTMTINNGEFEMTSVLFGKT